MAVHKKCTCGFRTQQPAREYDHLLCGMCIICGGVVLVDAWEAMPIIHTLKVLACFCFIVAVVCLVFC